MTLAAPAERRTRPYRWTLWLALPILLCLAVYWNGLKTWFLMDDYAWLGLRDEVRTFGNLGEVLFRPQAQGTVRVFSERVFFLVFSTLFGFEALPFKIWIFLTHAVNIVLAGLLAFRLTGSRLAAVTAPTLWTLHAALLVPLSWTASYNQVLWASCLLAATLAFIRYSDTGQRRWLAVCWAVYLAGFGVLELNVVVPAILLLYALCCARERWRVTLPFFIPAAVFAAVHFALIPKAADPTYGMHFDSDLIGTFWYYVQRGAGPVELGKLVDQRWRLAGYAIAALMGLCIAVFAALRVRRRDGLPVFLLGWFALTIAPVLPLKRHLIEYYLTAPVIGFAVLAAWAFASAWNARRWAGIALAVLFAAYGAGMYALISGALEWRRDNSLRLRDLLLAAEQLHERDPKPLLLLSGVDHDLYAAGFNDRPFRLFTPAKVYVTPGSEDELKRERHELRGVDEYVISERDVKRALDRNEATVLHVDNGRIRNVTARYAAMIRNKFAHTEQRRIDAGLPASEDKLGPTWYPIEQGFRWMPESATVRLAAPERPGAVLYVEGYVPAAIVARESVNFSVKVEGATLGFKRFSKPDERFSLVFPLPAKLAGKPYIDVELAVDRTIQSPDGRRLGLIFGVFEVKPAP